MNFKIEINYLNIDNYPSVAEHFEAMAEEGWLIDKVIVGSLFIYKKIEPQALDFSISPYEVETAFTMKSKDDLEEFKTVTENVGWRYATKSYDLHIYYKSRHADAIPLHTDEAEEFKVLERIAKRYLRAQYIGFPLLLIVTWFTVSGIFSNIRSMKDGFIQILALALPFAIAGSLNHIIDLRRFLKTNRENIELGEPLTFNASKQWVNKTIFLVFYLVLLAVIVYLLYSSLVLQNLRALTRLLPLVVGGIIGLMYRAWIKPLRRGLGFKLGSFLLTLVIAGIVGIPLGWVSFNILAESGETLNPNEDAVLMVDNFVDGELDEWGSLTRNTSLLVPASHEYTSHYEEEVIQTEYAKALNEPLAENLVERYVQQAQNRFRGRFGQALSEGVYHSGLEASGFTEADFEQMYKGNAKIELDSIWEIIEKRSVTDASQTWDVDEAYFLSYENNEIVLREGQEVWYLAGLDFSKPPIVESAKGQLKIN